MKEKAEMDVNDGLKSPSSPPKNLVDEMDYDLEQSAWSLEKLKEAALHQRVPRPLSLAWAILLNAVPPPNTDIIASIRSHRNFYDDLKDKLCMDPRTVIGDDPLSQSDESVWRQHFCDNELKNLILQDVVRTFPDELYFRDKDVQDLMVRVLFYWSRSHSQVGYRQGMHEILAPLLFELYLDRKLAPNDISETLRYILSEDHLEHDSYMLFSAVMKGLERYYTTGDFVVPSSCGRRYSRNPNEVVRYLDSIRENYLAPLDPELATHLTNSNISMELFGIRWLRLLFGREFPRGELSALWGLLFAGGPALPSLHLVVVAMLLSVRTSLLHSDPGVILSALMRPSSVPASHIIALSLHLQSPLQHPRPPTPPPREFDYHDTEQPELEHVGMEQAGPSDSSSEGVAEGADVARELAALGVVRARLPPAAAALAAALHRAPPHVQRPLRQVLQLAALLECRNHALIDVETALEAAEGQPIDKVGHRALVPVTISNKRKPNNVVRQVNKVKEVPLKLFHQMECTPSDLPCLDPLRLRTE